REIFRPIAQQTNALPAISSANPKPQKSAQYRVKQSYARLRYNAVPHQSDRIRLQTIHRPVILQVNSVHSRVDGARSAESRDKPSAQTKLNARQFASGLKYHWRPTSAPPVVNPTTYTIQT